MIKCQPLALIADKRHRAWTERPPLLFLLPPASCARAEFSRRVTYVRQVEPVSAGRRANTHGPRHRVWPPPPIRLQLERTHLWAPACVRVRLLCAQITKVTGSRAIGRERGAPLAG